MTELTTQPEQSKPDFLSRSLASLMVLDWEKVAYGLFIVVALITRLWGLGERVMSHDESLHTQFSLQFFRGDGYSHTALMHGPFLFHITPVFYWLFGVSDFSARLPVALFGVVLVVLPYFLRPWLGRVGALFTSFFFLISPFIVYYSRYIRHDIYVIVWAMIIFIATWYYLRTRQEKYLWWFAGALALMFSTKEVAFIYVAIFGSFLVLRLAVLLWQAPWFRNNLSVLRTPLLVLALGVVLLGIGFVGLRATDGAAAAPTTATPADADQGFAADPNQDVQSQTGAVEEGSAARLLHWLQVAGAVTVGVAAFLLARSLRPQIDDYPEFDLIVLYSTLLLPLMSPFLAVLAGYPPRDYTINHCELAGQATMTPFQLALGRLLNPICLDAYLSSNMVVYGFFILLTFAAAIYVGLWWKRRRWLIAAIIFHAIFFILYTSVFTNPGRWFSGIYDSLAYWLEQQDVQRGSQPAFYYLFLVPLYEFLPLIFSLLAVRLWTARQRLNKIVGYWVTLILLTLLAYSFTNWFTNRPIVADAETSSLIALIVAGLIFLAGGLYWLLVRARQLRQEYELGHSWRDFLDPQELVGFVPMLIWWLLLTWVAYSYAGEKMPWLSTHFVIPMALLGGWYMNEKLAGISARQLFSRNTLLLIGLIILFLGALFLALKPLILGQVQFGDQTMTTLVNIGQFLGALLVAGVLFYLLRELSSRVERPLRAPAWLLAIFVLLSLLTIRFTYMANGPNADYATEFMVYAHAAPAVKDAIMQRVEDLSFRLYGDKSIKVAWGDDGTWPMQWYLRDYPNRFYAGKSPSAGITDYPVVIVGHRDLANFENFLDEDEYLTEDYIFLWWPMEKYRDISWNAIFGRATQYPQNELGEAVATDVGTGRGLFSADVRQALWDIFFYRDYEKYGEVFNGVYRTGEWPLNARVRLYIRRDVLANLWDYGVAAAAIQPPVDPYAEGELVLTPDMVIGDGGLNEGALMGPRNVAIGPEGNLYVLDSANHRVVVFDEEGNLVTTWGSPGAEPGQFNEPWGIAVDGEFVYVADTWNHRIQKFTLAGDLVTTWGQYGTVADLGPDSGGFFFGPRSIALLPDNQMAVTDTGNHRIQLFDRDGDFLRAVGSLGSQPGQFNEPVGLASGGDWLFLNDTWNARIQRLTTDLQPNYEWPVDGWEGDSTENKPYLAVDSAGRVYATDPENYRVLIFSPSGQYLGRFGQQGTTIDRLGLPNGIAIDDADNIYLTDAVNNRVLRFPAIDFGNLTPPQPAEGLGGDNDLPPELPLDDEGALQQEEELPAGEDLPAGVEEPSPTPLG